MVIFKENFLITFFFSFPKIMTSIKTFPNYSTINPLIFATVLQQLLQFHAQIFLSEFYNLIIFKRAKEALILKFASLSKAREQFNWNGWKSNRRLSITGIWLRHDGGYPLDPIERIPVGWIKIWPSAGHPSTGGLGSRKKKQ